MISDKKGYYVTIEYDSMQGVGFDCLYCYDYDYVIDLLRDCIYLGRSSRTGSTPGCKLIKVIKNFSEKKDITKEVRNAI